MPTATPSSPELASPNGLAERMLEACLDVAERRSGERPDLATGSTDRDSPVGGAMDTMLLEHPVFEESLMNPVMLALVTHLCDYNVVLSSMSCSIKGPSDVQFHLHTDTRLPSPLPAQALVCKCMYLLTDFNRDKGSTVFVPGSHKWCRSPEGSETSVDNDHARSHRRTGRIARGLSGQCLAWPRTIAWHRGCA